MSGIEFLKQFKKREKHILFNTGSIFVIPNNQQTNEEPDEPRIICGVSSINTNISHT